MRPVERSAKALWVTLVVVVVLAGGFTLYFALKQRPSTAQRISEGRNALSGIDDRGRILQVLASLSWADVAPTFEGIGSNADLADRVIEVAQPLSHPPAAYLEALLRIVSDNPDMALATFERIPLAEIPPTHLYAPYRLHNTIRPSESNPFREAMNRAVEQRQVPALIRARVLGAEGRLSEALKAYLQSDPSAWTVLDVQVFRSFRMHAALANSTAVMIQGALRGGRVPRGLRGELIEVLEAPQSPVALETFKTQLLQQIERNPEIRRAAIAGADRQLAARRLFAAKQYGALLDQCRDSNPLELPDETVLMLVLAAAQERAGAAFDEWSQELKRRYPTPEVAEWVQEIRPTTR